MRFRSLGVVAALGLASCSRSSSSTSALAAESVSPAPTPAGAFVPPRPSVQPLSPRAFADLFESLSAESGSIVGDRIVCNETPHLPAIRELELRATPGGAYIGVGPTQNLTYIAVTRPRIAFIVDARRKNALLQLLYKSIFDVAKSRAEFLSLLVGRPYDAARDPGALASVEQILAAVRAERRDARVFEHESAALRARLKDLDLGSQDIATLHRLRKQLFDQGLDSRFGPSAPDGSPPPSLQELMAETDAAGKPHSFVATRKEFLVVRELERHNRVIPVVGSLAGRHALAAVAAELKRRGLQVSVFYVSNAERNLFRPATWQRWVRNVEALPHDARSLFVRGVVGEGWGDPVQTPGHRTTTVLGYMNRFVSGARAGGYQSFRQLVTDDTSR